MAGSKTSAFQPEIATLTFAESMMEKNILILRTPVVVAGARTSSIILSLASSSYFNFRLPIRPQNIGPVAPHAISERQQLHQLQIAAALRADPASADSASAVPVSAERAHHGRAR
jgi:hypothetical protein